MLFLVYHLFYKKYSLGIKYTFRVQLFFSPLFSFNIQKQNWFKPNERILDFIR